MNSLSIEAFKKADKTPIVLVLDNLRSQNNVGSIFRTADAWLIQAIYLCGITAQPPHREIHKTALGATESVDWRYFSKTIDALSQLKEKGFELVAIEQADKSIMLNNFIPKPGKQYALILGNEVDGVGEEVMKMIDTCIELPQYGTKHSLNVAVSTGVVIWDLLCKIKTL